MSIKDIAHRVEELYRKAWMLDSMALVLHDAIIEGSNTADAYDGALYALCEFTSDLHEETRNFMNCLFDAMRENRKELHNERTENL